jgi:hypothetical protein
VHVDDLLHRMFSLIRLSEGTGVAADAPSLTNESPEG